LRCNARIDPRYNHRADRRCPWNSRSNCSLLPRWPHQAPRNYSR